MTNLSSTPFLNVGFINAINGTTPYGVTLLNTRLGVVDANGVNMFPNENGTVNIRTVNAANLAGGIYTATSAGTQGVVTPTEPTLAANTTYGFTLTQYNPYTGETVILPVSYNTGVGALTAGTAATAWEVLLKASNIQATYSILGGALTITAKTGYEIITMTSLIGGVTAGATTAGAYSSGEAADMTALNGRGSSWSSYTGYVSTNNYAKYDMIYSLQDGTLCETVFFVNSGDANFSNFQTKLLTDALQLGEGSPTAALIQNTVKTQA
jgi:hypothetical protein